MGLVKGLKNINKHIDDEEKKFSGDGTKWMKLDDKQAVTVQFLQELDEDAPNYSEKNGLGVMAVEHVNPKNWRKKALCTIDDEGRCFGCEQHNKDFKAGWKQKSRLYINVLVDNGIDEPFVAILSQGTSAKSITPALLDIAEDSEDGITTTLFKIKRSGLMTDTSYLLTPKGKTDENPEQHEVFDLDKIVKHVPYVEQEAFYLEGQDQDDEKVPVSAGASAETEW